MCADSISTELQSLAAVAGSNLLLPIRELAATAMSRVSIPPDDLCLYHCVSFARDPELFLSVPRTDAGHFIGDQASMMTQRALAIRDELVELLRVAFTWNNTSTPIRLAFMESRG